MSAVLNQAKALYRKTLCVEAVLLAAATVFAMIANQQAVAFSLLFGGLSALLPHCLFVFWVFFRPQAKNANKMTAFYRGEGLKWLLTILLIVILFKSYTAMNFLAFFAGYFVMLLCNSLLPIGFQRQTQRQLSN